jgi:hypothetical protein
MNRNSLALVITLALTATQEEVADAINAIEHQFGITYSAADVVSPADLVRNGAIVTDKIAEGPVTTTNGDEVDSTGIKWDERIHASTKAKTADGEWRARRNVDAGTKAKIEKQLRAGATATVTTPDAPINIPAPPSTTAAPLTLPPVPGANVVNPVYADFVAFVASQSAPAGRLTPEWVNASINTLTSGAIGNLQDLAHRADLVPAIHATFKQSLGL